MKKAKPALSLKAETVRRLSVEQLQAVNGGMLGNNIACKTAATYCMCESSSTWGSHCCALDN